MYMYTQYYSIKIIYKILSLFKKLRHEKNMCAESLTLTTYVLFLVFYISSCEFALLPGAHFLSAHEVSLVFLISQVCYQRIFSVFVYLRTSLFHLCFGRLILLDIEFSADSFSLITSNRYFQLSLASMASDEKSAINRIDAPLMW